MTKVLIVEKYELGPVYEEILADKFEVVGVTADEKEALELCEQGLPDVVLINPRLKNNDDGGAEVTRIIRQRFPNVRIIGHGSMGSKKQAIGMLNAGANGYLTDRHSGTEFIQIIEAVVAMPIYMRTIASDIYWDSWDKPE